MLLEKNIKITINRKQEVDKYNKIGYNCKKGDIIKIKISDLSMSSHINVKVKCDNCSIIKKIRYQDYNNYTNNGKDKYYCNNKECSLIKRTKSVIKKYGVKNVFQNEKIKDKIKQTNLLKYNCEFPQQNKEIQQKTIKTNLKNYGYDYPTQNYDEYKKRMKNSFMMFDYSGLTYQGSYEKDFLDKYYNKIKIENGLSIEYIENSKKKIYLSDFYIPSKNLIVEIKSDYWYNIHKNKCILKEKYTKMNYNYILILNKNYIEFEKLIG